MRLVDAEIYPNEVAAPARRWGSRPPADPLRLPRRGTRATAHDIELGGGDEPRLAGVLRIDGESPGAWQAALSTGPLFGGSPEAECAVDVEGRFELVAPATGSYQLVLMGTFGERGLQALVAPVEITEGTTPWSLDLATASLTVENVPMPAGSDPERVHLWQGPDELLCLTGLRARRRRELRRAARAPRPRPPGRHLGAGSVDPRPARVDRAAHLRGPSRRDEPRDVAVGRSSVSSRFGALPTVAAGVSRAGLARLSAFGLRSLRPRGL